MHPAVQYDLYVIIFKNKKKGFAVFLECSGYFTLPVFLVTSCATDKKGQITRIHAVSPRDVHTR